MWTGWGLGLCSALNRLICCQLLIGAGASTAAFMVFDAWPNNLARLYWFFCLDIPLSDQLWVLALCWGKEKIIFILSLPFSFIQSHQLSFMCFLCGFKLKQFSELTGEELEACLIMHKHLCWPYLWLLWAGTTGYTQVSWIISMIGSFLLTNKSLSQVWQGQRVEY